MPRVAITGMGIISSLGNSIPEVLDALREGRSGVEIVPERRELGFRSALALAFALLTGGYALLGAVPEKWAAYTALGLIMCGGAIVKPVISDSRRSALAAARGCMRAVTPSMRTLMSKDDCSSSTWPFWS